MAENNDVVKNEKRIADNIGITVDELAEWKLGLVRSFMYPILLKMLENNLLDLEKIKDKQYLMWVIKENAENVLPGMEVFVNLRIEFIEIAEHCVKEKKLLSAIVLIATAIEHIINIFYRNLLAYKNIPEEQVTDIIKKSNFDSKLGWLLSVTSEITVPPELLKEIKEIIELRNAIVHHKYIPEKMDVKNGSVGNLREKIANIDSEKLLAMPDKLESIFMEHLEQIDPKRKIASDLWEVLFNENG